MDLGIRVGWAFGTSGTAELGVSRPAGAAMTVGAEEVHVDGHVERSRGRVEMVGPFSRDMWILHEIYRY